MGCLVTDEEVVPCDPEYEITGTEGPVGIVVGEWLDSTDKGEDMAYMQVQDIGYSVGIYLKRDALARLLERLYAVHQKLSES